MANGKTTDVYHRDNCCRAPDMLSQVLQCCNGTELQTTTIFVRGPSEPTPLLPVGGRVDPEQTSRTDPSAAKWTRQTSRTCCEADNISCCRHRKFPTTIYVSARPSYNPTLNLPNSKRGEQDRMQCRLCSGTGAVKMSGSRRSRQTGRTPARALSRDGRSSALPQRWPPLK